MKVKKLMELLGNLDPEAHIINPSSYQDMSATIPVVETKCEPEKLDDGIYQLKWECGRLGSTLQSFKRDIQDDPYSKGWVELNRPCPKCGGRMIENVLRIECSELFCDYVEKRK